MEHGNKCPRCEKTKDVYVYDRGLKYVLRRLAGNNRFACSLCSITWRAKKPNHFMKLIEPRSDNPDSPEHRRFEAIGKSFAERDRF